MVPPNRESTAATAYRNLRRNRSMEIALLRKIREQLERGISTECQVVYLLVEIRKLLDRERTSGAQYGSLRLYCNWAVHVELSKAQAQEIVKKADQLYFKLIKGI